MSKPQSELWTNRSFPYVPMNDRDPKPRSRSITEIRGPYYAAVTPTYTKELLEGMGEHVDGYKYAGGSFALMPPDYVKKINRICHDHNVYVSTGGWIENILARAAHHVDDYIAECKRLDFDMIELSTGFIQLPTPDLLRLIEKVKKAGLKPKPEIGIQFGAGG
ncbi:MAG: phosphosulfolactate synthase, partial [Beijerinckiaceae bacterium]